MTDKAPIARNRFLTLCLAILWLSSFVACARTDSNVSANAFSQGSIQHGEYLSKVLCCRECHTPRQGSEEHLDPNLLLAGGLPFPSLGGSLVYSSNVTIASQYSEQTLDNVIRGRLAFKFTMPSSFFNGMAADDMRDLIAYLKTLRPMFRPLPDPYLPPGFVLPGPTAALPIPEHEPPKGTVERGEYLSRMFSCQYCHTSPEASGGHSQDHNLEGARMPVPEAPIFAPNLTPDRETGLGAWSDSEIKRAVTKGIAHDGRQLEPIMPSMTAYQEMADQDASDLVLYLRSLKPVRVSPQFATH